MHTGRCAGRISRNLGSDARQEEYLEVHTANYHEAQLGIAIPPGVSGQGMYVTGPKTIELPVSRSRRPSMRCGRPSMPSERYRRSSW